MNLTPSDLTWQEPTERKRKKLNPHFDAFLAVLAEHAGQWAVWSTTDKATRTQYLRNLRRGRLRMDLPHQQGRLSHDLRSGQVRLVETKRCSKCTAHLPLADFNKNQSYCRQCAADYGRDYKLERKGRGTR